MDLNYLKAFVDGIFVENHYASKSTLTVTDPKKGRVLVEVPFTSSRDKWTKFNFIKANFMRNNKGIRMQDLISFNRKAGIMAVNIKVRNFVTASKGEKDIEKADKNKKGTVKKPAATQKPRKGAEKPAPKPVQKSARKPAPAPKAKPGSAKSKVAAALQKAKARKVFNRVKALRAAKGRGGKNPPKAKKS